MNKPSSEALFLDQTLAECKAGLLQLGYTSQDAALFLQELGISSIEQRLSQAQRLSHFDLKPHSEGVAKLFASIEQKKPMAYILGKQGFWSLDLICNEAVLIPRPDSEVLVEQALHHLHGIEAPRVLDLGTGSGAIALAIAKELPLSNIKACDISPAALAVAKLNAERNAIGNVAFVESNWFANMKQEHFDLIVSNPPYISADDEHLAHLQDEPIGALVSADEGFADIEKIAKAAPSFLKPGAWLLVEHGYQQATRARDIFANAGFDKVYSEKDYAGNDRISGGQRR